MKCLLQQGEQLRQARRSADPHRATGLIAAELPNWLGMLQHRDGCVRVALDDAVSDLWRLWAGLEGWGQYQAATLLAAEGD